MSFVLVSIGNDHGAIDELFNRDENEVKGLPVQGKRTVENITYHFPEFPLRLYLSNFILPVINPNKLIE